MAQCLRVVIRVLRNLGIIVPDPGETERCLRTRLRNAPGKGLTSAPPSHSAVTVLQQGRVDSDSAFRNTGTRVSTAPLSSAMRLLFLVPFTAAFSTLPRPAPYEPPDGLVLIRDRYQFEGADRFTFE